MFTTPYYTLLTYSLTPRCTVLPEQLTGLQLVKKFPAFHGTPKVHYRTHKSTPPVSILGQPKPAHIPTTHLLQIHPNIIHPSTPRSPQWSLSLRFPHQDPKHSPFFTHTRHMAVLHHNCINFRILGEKNFVPTSSVLTAAMFVVTIGGNYKIWLYGGP